jgi:hypothetical protein
MCPTSASSPSDTSIAAAERDARLRRLEPLHAPRRRVRRELRPPLEVREPERGLAGRAGEPQVLARGRRVAAQRVTGREGADRGDGDGARPAGRVAADELDAVRIGEREHPASEGLEPGLVCLRQREREQEPARIGAHRGEVREACRERLVAEPARIGAGQEVRAFGKRVGSDREREAGGRGDERAVVADRRGPVAHEVAPDQLELGQRGRRAQVFPASRGRRLAASLSSTPFTYL